MPLEELGSDLEIKIQFKFKHFEQRFRIDPEQVGEYEKENSLYKQYTASDGNITIIPEISQKAKEIAGDETNPYLIARKIYDHVVDEIIYSYMPHLAVEPLGIPESVYVYQRRYGDCGAQSMYFCALLRALGIPCRATGGWQLAPGHHGNHFWAEFYLPRYGWVPVDTSVAQIYLYLPDLTEKEKKAYKDFYFGSMDPYRFIIQKDVDVHLIPPANEPPLVSLAIQTPATLCDTMLEIPGLLSDEYWKIEIKP